MGEYTTKVTMLNARKTAINALPNVGWGVTLRTEKRKAAKSRVWQRIIMAK
jgi:hypothetical protein